MPNPADCVQEYDGCIASSFFEEEKKEEKKTLFVHSDGSNINVDGKQYYDT